MLRNPDLCAKYDLRSLRMVYTGAAPLGAETHEDMLKAFPFLQVAQGYGMTETSTVVLSTSETDIMIGTSGSLAPACRAKLIGEDGHEITEYDKRGELWVQSPSVTLGYLNNERATSEAFVWDHDGRWIRTGDVAVVKKAPSGYEHFAVVDRLKELIKVKVRACICPLQVMSAWRNVSIADEIAQGHQVAPAELEAHLLSHPAVNDCTVIPVPDESSGEVPKAFVVKAASAASRPDAEVTREIHMWVEEHKARYKWLKGGIEFVDAIPKSPSGKILRRLLKDKEREKRRASGAKL